MARQINKLTARSVAALSKPGRHSDGGGLYLVVEPKGAKRWVFLFRWSGKLKEMGFGGVSAVSLANAREKAATARKVLDAGRNPIEVRKAAASEEAARITFGTFADQLVDDIKSGFRNEKHRWQWKHTLEVYAAKLREVPLDEVSTEKVLEVLQPLWQSKQETASRLRGRIERVLDAAKAKGLRSGENPARWRGHLDALLPSRKKLQRGHHPAMPYAEVPAFIQELRERSAVAALMMEFAILSASRTGEVVGAKWSEIDRKARVWTVPPERMKAGKEHRVPLGPRALEILATVEPLRAEGDYVFPGPRKGKPFSNMAMLALLKKRMERPDITVHGFRSSFRDWAGECTSFPREVAEAALAHVVGDEVERAYRRGDALEKRRNLMLAWEEFITSANTDDKVVPLRVAGD
ncbi:tyrosine-type recombinase/integrase [Aquabacter cavernae]|uniref:tyrosine-type recombinase/integrase n=1 Tax=Aquabacter cavernae TaxID=2496029 RepID=UPI000F8C86ED|nr:site-specific integrase [Aquabacter cavernae]